MAATVVAAASVRRVLLGAAGKTGAGWVAAAAVAAPVSAGLCSCCSRSSLKANPFCTAAPQQQQQPSSAPPPDMKNYLWKRYNEAKKVTKAEQPVQSYSVVRDNLCSLAICGAESFVFCHSCIATSLRNNTWTCPYCRAYLPSEGIPATDIIKMMKNIYQKCTECETQVCLSEMRAHLRTCDQYIEKYGPIQEVSYPVTRYPCPLCQYELDESDLLDHFLTHHRSERRAVYCPICRLLPGGGPSYYSRSFIRHLQLRHTFYYEDYIDINIVEEVLIERVLDQSFLEYVHVNNPNTA